MKTENILTIEESGENRINLVRDRLFWQAWNRSAFLFASHIKNYQVHIGYLVVKFCHCSSTIFPNSFKFTI